MRERRGGEGREGKEERGEDRRGEKKEEQSEGEPGREGCTPDAHTDVPMRLLVERVVALKVGFQCQMSKSAVHWPPQNPFL